MRFSLSLTNWKCCTKPSEKPMEIATLDKIAFVCVFAFVAVLTLPVSPAHARPPYIVTDLGALVGDNSLATGINNSGQVVGWTNNVAGSTTTHAFLYSGGSVTDLGTLGGNKSTANAINNSGQVVGSSNDASGGFYAFLYSGGSMTNIGSPVKGTGFGINNSGQVAGVFLTPDINSHACLYSNGTVRDLGTLGGDNSYAYGINDSGLIVGYSQTTGNATYHAFIDSGGLMTDLGTLGGSYSMATGVNNSGQVVGVASPGGSATFAFLYSDGTMTELPTLLGQGSQADAINNSGQIVGFYNDASGGSVQADRKGFLYSNGIMSDLNTLAAGSGWNLQVPEAINDLGQIVGFGTNPSGQTDAFLLTPAQVPEPASMGLLGIGCVGMFNRRRRARK